MLKIVKNEDLNLHHRSLVSSIRQEVQVLRERGEQLSTIEKLEGTGDCEVISETSNSNYDFELNQKEAKGN